MADISALSTGAEKIYLTSGQNFGIKFRNSLNLFSEVGKGASLVPTYNIIRSSYVISNGTE